jgi:hypothetical protein
MSAASRLRRACGAAGRSGLIGRHAWGGPTEGITCHRGRRAQQWAGRLFIRPRARTARAGQCSRTTGVALGDDPLDCTWWFRGSGGHRQRLVAVRARPPVMGCFAGSVPSGIPRGGR